MRTTVEIRDDQRLALLQLAHERGIRGFSDIVQEAIDFYLAEHAEDDLRAALALRGSITDDQAAQMERRIAEAWATWRLDP
jgi:hypothetical protein